MSVAILEAPAVTTPTAKRPRVRYANRGTVTYLVNGQRFTPPRNVSLKDFVQALNVPFSGATVRRLYGATR